MSQFDPIVNAAAPATDAVDLAGQVFDADAAGLVTAREAWQYRLLPLRYEDGVLVCASMLDRIADADAFIRARCSTDVRFVLAEPIQLEQKIMQRYPNP